MQDGKVLEIVCTTMRIFLTLQSCTELPGGSVVKSPPASAGDVGTIPGSGRSLQKEVVTQSSILAWEIPTTEQPGGLQSTGLQKELDRTERLNSYS